MGHEFTGEIVEVGSAVRGFKVGDLVVSPFTVNCGECFYCARKCSSRCAKGKLYGSVMLDGGQADYARVPSAEKSMPLDTVTPSRTVVTPHSSRARE